MPGRLNLPQMVSENTDNHCTAFTVSVDHVDTSTGISAAERGYTCRACADLNTRPEDLRRPGHVFPLVARRGGVLTRSGHTEATVDLCRLAGLEECGLCCEIMRDDGTMMRTPELQQMAREHGCASSPSKTFRIIYAATNATWSGRPAPKCPLPMAIFKFTAI